MRAPARKWRGSFFFATNTRAMQYGYKCEDCETAIFPTTTRSELAWLRDRVHVVREVAKHSSGGLDTWMHDGLEFLNDHQGHSIVLVSRR